MRWFSLVASLALAYAAGVPGSFFTAGSWYTELAKAPLNPPSWLFAPVWGVLYALMALAAWRVWLRRRRDPRASRALSLYGAQLALNAAWAPVFFGLQVPILALMVLGALLVFLVFALVAFWHIDREAGLLLVPYLLWALFALYLNAGIAWLNPLP